MTESKEKRWIRIRIFTSTWKIWRDTATTSEKYDKDLDAVVEIEETEEHEKPVIRYTEVFHRFLHTNERLYEMVCIIPFHDKNRIIELWKTLTEKPLLPLEKLERLLDYILEYDSTPLVSFYQDSDKISIEIN